MIPSHPSDAGHLWHPFTEMSSFRLEQAPIIVEADGFFLIDADGRRYLDGHSSLWCNIHGHRVAAMDDAVRCQLNRVAHSTLLGLSNGPSLELAGELVRRVPRGLTKVFYADCGAAGVEVALKMAYQYHRQKPHPEPRDLFVGLTAAYHGDTVGTVSLGGIDRFHALFSGLTFPVLRVPTPAAPGSSLSECLTQTEAILSRHADRIAGFVVEPLVQAAAGILVHPPGYLRAVRELTHRFGILLIADEIAVGFGRTGTLFACEQEDVSPDLLILSKGLTGGYLPLAATLTTEEIYEAFLGEPWSGREFSHGHTYTGNPLACAAALASLRLIDENRVLENVGRIAECLRQELAIPLSVESVSSEEASPGGLHPPLRKSFCVVRQKGAMVGIELLRETSSAPSIPFPPELRIGHQVTRECRRQGVIVRNIGDVIVVMPAPAMPATLVKQLCETVRTAIAKVLMPATHE